MLSRRSSRRSLAETPHYYEFEVAPNNQWIDLEITSEASSHRTHSGIPTSCTPPGSDRDTPNLDNRVAHPGRVDGSGEHRSNTEWRINLYRADGAGSGAERNLFCWSPLPSNNGSFHQPASFGVLKFAPHK